MCSFVDKRTKKNKGQDSLAKQWQPTAHATQYKLEGDTPMSLRAIVLAMAWSLMGVKSIDSTVQYIEPLSDRAKGKRPTSTNASRDPSTMLRVTKSKGQKTYQYKCK